MIFRKALLNIKHVFWFTLQLLCETFLILSRIERDIIINVHTVSLHVTYPLFLSDINETLIFSTDFRKIHRYQISWKSVQWEPSCSMRTDGQTDMTKLIVAFRDFAKAPKNINKIWRHGWSPAALTLFYCNYVYISLHPSVHSCFLRHLCTQNYVYGNITNTNRYIYILYSYIFIHMYTSKDPQYIYD
jgi:hypothetical protein